MDHSGTYILVKGTATVAAAGGTAANNNDVKYLNIMLHLQIG